MKDLYSYSFIYSMIKTKVGFISFSEMRHLNYLINGKIKQKQTSKTLSFTP